ncbi:MAG: hypothetical protein WC848_05955 [Parcubacteria group bacterium]|jgi:WD40 repeat protein
MKLKIENKIKFFTVIGAGIILIAGLTTLAVQISRKHSSLKPASVNSEAGSVSIQDEVVIPDKKLLVVANDAVEKVDLLSGKVEATSLLEQSNFDSFEGFPVLGDNKNEDVEQGVTLLSPDERQALVTVTTYKSVALLPKDADQPVLSVSDYLCEIENKSCSPSTLLSEIYQGIDPELQKRGTSLSWFRWNSQRNLLFGHLTFGDLGDVSPVYACDTQIKICNKTEGFDSLKVGDVSAVVPAGAFSPSLKSFIMINQHAKPNVEIGKQWELLLYASDDLLKPEKTYDISAAINQDEDSGYDSVRSVAWSKDEKRLALATNNRIFIFNFETGVLAPIYTDPATGEDDPSLDSSALFISSDGKYVAFIDSVDTTNEIEDEAYNVLKKIDLENNNEVTEILGDYGLSLKSQ